MNVVSSAAGTIVVEGEDGCVFLFEIGTHGDGGVVLNLTNIEWPVLGAPPDANELEQAAGRLAEQDAKEQGWLFH